MSSFVRLIALAAGAAALTLTACASAPERRQLAAEELAIYQRHAGEPVERVRSFRMRGWQPIGEQSLVLENRLNEWYLIEVAGPCQGLRFVQTIGVETTLSSLQARFDSIIVEGLPCRIQSIRPIDVRAARQEVRALRERG